MAFFYYRVGDKTILASGRSLNIRRYGIIHMQVAGTFSTKLIVARKDLAEVKSLCCFCGVEYWTDNRILGAS